MTILMRMFGLEVDDDDDDDDYGCPREPSVITAMRKVTGRWDKEDETCAETKMATKEIMHHDDFLKRMRRTLYVGGSTSKIFNHSTNSQAISQPLADYAAGYFSESHRGHSLNRLNPVFVTQLQSTPCTLILAMIYLDRLQETDPTYARKITPTELFLVSMLVSTKFYYGYDENTAGAVDYSIIGDIPLERIHRLELELLCALNWNLNVSHDEFFAKLCAVEYELALRQGCTRGWMTYTEMAQLFPRLQLAKDLFKFSAVFALSYTASVFTIAGAFLLASQVPGTSLYRAGPTTCGDSSSSLTSDSFPRSDLPTIHSSNDTQQHPDTNPEIDSEHIPTSTAPTLPPFQLPNPDADDIPPNSTSPSSDLIQHIFDRQKHRLDPNPLRLTNSDFNDSSALSPWHDFHPFENDGSCQAAQNYGPLLTWMQFMY